MNERDIFLAAIEIADVEERARYVERACGGEAALRAQVQQLLRNHEQASRFLETPATGKDVASDATVLPPAVDVDRNPPGEPASAAGEIRRFLLPTTRPGWLGRLGHYEIEQVLGRGAFGIVAKAQDEKLHRVVAIKLMNPELAVTSPPRKRFLREARTAAAVTHENIVAIYAVEEDPLPYLVMEYVPGQTLQQRLDEHGPLDVADILRIGRQIAAGLAAAHAAHLIHRDIKPANILLTGGPAERVKISDFGLARAADDASLTTSGLIAGTPLYMAPEQARGQSLDHRVDLFSLGSVLYQMASGRPPFRAANTVAVLKRVCEDQPRPIEEIIPGTPSWLSALIFRLLRKDPNDRYQSAQEVADLLSRCLTELQQTGQVRCVEGVVPSTALPAMPEGKTRWFGLSRTTCGWLVGGLLAGGAILAGVANLDQSSPVQEPGPRPAPAGAVADSVAPPSGDADTLHRQLAERVLQAGGTVTVIAGGPHVEVRAPSALPAGAIRVIALKLGEGRLQAEVLAQCAPVPELELIELVNADVTDRDITALTGYPRLRALTLGCPAVTDEGVAKLNRLQELEELNLGSTPVSAAGLRSLAGLTRLRRVGLGGNLVTAAHLAALSQFPGLTFLQLSHSRISDHDLEPLVDFPALQMLFLDSTAITDRSLMHLQQVRPLRVLDLRQTAVSDEGLTRLLELPHLEELQVSSPRVTAAGVQRLQAALPKCRIQSEYGELAPANGPMAPSSPVAEVTARTAAKWLLERGGLLGMEVNGEQIWTDNLAQLPAGPLRIFSLEGSRCPALTDEALSQLAPGLTDLEALRGNNLAFCGTGFAAWPPSARLRSFASVGGGRGSLVTDAGLEQLARITSLQHFNCNSRLITDAGLAHLSRMPNLIEIELSQAQITDSGLQQLAKMPHLRTLRLRDTPVTAAGIEQLRASLPNCQITY